MIVFGDENILLLDEILRNHCEFKLYSGRKLSNNDLLESKCEILLTRSQTKVNRELIEGTSVKLVATATSGADHIDEAYLKSAGIVFDSAKGSNANSVAEYVVFAIVKWSLLNNIDLNEATIGVVGFGSIGSIVAYYSAMLGLNVIVNDPPLKDSGVTFPNYVQYCDLDELIEKSNILSNHVPLTINCNYPTYKLFNADNLTHFQANGLIIHASRGWVIDEAALHYLKDNKDATLVIDVWEKEPNFDVNLANKCMIATPHVAGYSYNGKLNGTKMILDSYCQFTSSDIDKSLLTVELEKSSLFSIHDFNSRKQIYEHLSLHRNIDEDSDSLKLLCSKDEMIKVNEFDRLRKEYPIRFESLRTGF